MSPYRLAGERPFYANTVESVLRKQARRTRESYWVATLLSATLLVTAAGILGAVRAHSKSTEAQGAPHCEPSYVVWRDGVTGEVVSRVATGDDCTVRVVR